VFLQLTHEQLSQYLPFEKHSQYNLKQFEFLQVHLLGIELLFVEWITYNGAGSKFLEFFFCEMLTEEDIGECGGGTESRFDNDCE
jgi:hypothetical protein